MACYHGGGQLCHKAKLAKYLCRSHFHRISPPPLENSAVVSTGYRGCISMSKAKALVASHLAIFVAGIVAGKSIDTEELSKYRALADEASASSYRRRIWKLSVVAAVGCIMGVSVISMSRSRSRAC